MIENKLLSRKLQGGYFSVPLLLTLMLLMIPLYELFDSKLYLARLMTKLRKAENLANQEIISDAHSFSSFENSASMLTCQGRLCVLSGNNSIVCNSRIKHKLPLIDYETILKNFKQLDNSTTRLTSASKVLITGSLEAKQFVVDNMVRSLVVTEDINIGTLNRLGTLDLLIISATGEINISNYQGTGKICSLAWLGYQGSISEFRPDIKQLQDIPLLAPYILALRRT